MNEPVINPHFLARIKMIYEAMEKEYDEVAAILGLSCTGCPDNCCDSYFLHHTHLEWVYLWHGLQQLPQDRITAIQNRARDYIRQCEEATARQEWPKILCPLNESGKCSMYQYRLMVCRTHGVPATLRRPDGRELTFPGCFRCQEIVESKKTTSVPMVNRTPLLQQMALMEQELLRGRRDSLPRVKMTIAEMLVQKPPLL